MVGGAQSAAGYAFEFSPRHTRLFAAPDGGDFGAPMAACSVRAALSTTSAKGPAGEDTATGGGWLLLGASAPFLPPAWALAARMPEAVVFLVRHHLDDVPRARSREPDRSGPVVNRFTGVVGAPTGRLVALYLLTVADSRGTSPQGCGRPWKARLLETLFSWRGGRLGEGSPAGRTPETAGRASRRRGGILRLYGGAVGARPRGAAIGANWDNRLTFLATRHRTSRGIGPRPAGGARGNRPGPDRAGGPPGGRPGKASRCCCMCPIRRNLFGARHAVLRQAAATEGNSGLPRAKTTGGAGTRSIPFCSERGQGHPLRTCCSTRIGETTGTTWIGAQVGGVSCRRPVQGAAVPGFAAFSGVTGSGQLNVERVRAQHTCCRLVGRTARPCCYGARGAWLGGSHGIKTWQTAKILTLRRGGRGRVPDRRPGRWLNEAAVAAGAGLSRPISP